MATVAGLEEYFTHSGTVEAARRSAQAAGEVRRVGDAEGAEVNILARKWSKDDPHSKTVLSFAEYRELALDAEEVEASNREQDGVEDLKLLYARDTDLDNPASAGQHLDDELKRASELHIRAILDKKPAVNSSNYGMHRTKLAKHSVNAQFYTTMYARRTGEHLVKMTGGLAAWKNATRQQQHNLVRHLFSEFPLKCCKLMFHLENNSFDFDTVRATASDCIETAKWNKFWKSLLVGMMVTSITLVNFAEDGTKAEKKAAKNGPVCLRTGDPLRCRKASTVSASVLLVTSLHAQVEQQGTLV
ncbi:hypothetical protein LTR02_009196 [Friedmanniomyces endolithicus]|nr:hypothetical protein LTR94_012099 [Friedmanniomyces endolithicus]KAK0776792.1 hypothetical protein LTR75_016134 [Friedmanniomyces endolithicus]KAK0790643.1 hypothetical protein LTR59_009137 [Friedmanniomyces endolithicus]KAK0795277.1 hypothetical protein LTR38_008981 [Friedmanniomyces endolithicus]KAK0847109.1 hypothetical protein LTR03_006455 [Friedmanniomyces endolithicus]